MRQRWPLPVAALLGAIIALQLFMNGRLGRELGSALLAAGINNAVGLTALVAVAAVTGAMRRGRARVRAGHRPRPWHLLGGLGGAALIGVSAFAAPEVGVALLTVALVAGQTSGSVLVDSAGLGPSGRQAATAPRVAGAALAVAAVALSAAGGGGDLEVGLLALAVVAGLLVAGQQAANGRLAQVTGEPVLAATINFAVGFTALGTLALLATGGTPPDGWDVPPVLLLGGFLGATVVVVSAIIVARVGVLALILSLTAGQAAGALVIDLVAPAEGEEVGLLTVAGVVLAVAAVGVSRR